MGKVERKVQQHELEKHLDTAEFIGILYWYIKDGQKIEQEFIKAKSDLNEAFNEKMQEYKAKENKKCAVTITIE